MSATSTPAATRAAAPPSATPWGEELGRGRASSYGLLLGKVLHDLKQPLNTIRVVAQATRLDLGVGAIDPEELIESMRDVQQAVDDVTGQLERLRAFAQPSLPPSSPEGKALDVEALCSALLEQLGEAFPALALELHRSASPATTLSRPDILEHALRELLDTSARVASSADSSEPKLSLVVEAMDGGLLLRLDWTRVDDSERGTGLIEGGATSIEGVATGQRRAELAGELIAALGGELERCVSSAPAGLTTGYRVSLRCERATGRQP